MPTLQIREALRDALDEEMSRDDRVFVMGEEVGYYNGAYKVTQGLLDKYGEQRVVDTPIAETGFAGVGVGAALGAGLRGRVRAARRIDARSSRAKLSMPAGSHPDGFSTTLWAPAHSAAARVAPLPAALTNTVGIGVVAMYMRKKVSPSIGSIIASSAMTSGWHCAMRALA